jgi:predicted metal-dependent hydrolase
VVVHVRPGTGKAKRQATVEEWHRELLRQAIPPLIEKWERSMGATVRRFFVQRMKTKWGICNHRAGSIRLNTDLARKPRECLEYIVVHEMAHLLEPTHNARFMDLMKEYMPKWEFRRDVLNSLPVRHESWNYLIWTTLSTRIGGPKLTAANTWPPTSMIVRILAFLRTVSNQIGSWRRGVTRE